jgi:hypothetical protein
MDLSAFRSTLDQAEPPKGLPAPLRALWWDAKGDWDRAHKAAQEQEGTAPCDWVHAYLHRKEGDAANADYWYRRAAQKPASGPLDTDWEQIATQLLVQRTPD